MTKDSAEKLRPGVQALLERAFADNSQQRVTDRHGRCSSILPAQQFDLPEQLADFLAGNDRAAVTGLDEDLHLAIEHDEDACGVISLFKDKMAAPIAPDRGVFEEKVAVGFGQHHDLALSCLTWVQ